MTGTGKANMRTIAGVALLTALAVAIFAWAPWRAAEEEKVLSETQKRQIGEVVRDYLLENPEILVEMSNRLREREEAEKQRRAAAAVKSHGDLIFRAPHDPVAGNPQGSIVVVEFMDYNCPYCKRSYKDLKALMERNSEVKVVFKEFPILGKGSQEAAQVALAALKQGRDKYWQLHQQLIEYPGRVDGKIARALAERLGLDMDKLEEDARSEDVMRVLSINYQLANALAIEGTPAFVIGDRVVRGAVPLEELEAAIAASRKQVASDRRSPAAESDKEARPSNP